MCAQPVVQRPGLHITCPNLSLHPFHPSPGFRFGIQRPYRCHSVRRTLLRAPPLPETSHYAPQGISAVSHACGLQRAPTHVTPVWCPAGHVRPVRGTLLVGLRVNHGRQTEELDVTRVASSWAVAIPLKMFDRSMGWIGERPCVSARTRNL